MTESPPPGQTYTEWVASRIPKGDGCGGCKNIEDGKCTIWGQEAAYSTKKCHECKNNKYIENVKQSKGE